MARGDDIRNILNLAKNMRDSYQGYSIQMIEEECGVSRRTAMRIKDIISDIFEIEEVVNPDSKIKKWRLKRGTLDRILAFSAEEIAELENCQKIIKSQKYTNRCDLLPDIIKKMKFTTSNAVQNDVDALLEVQGYAVHQYPKVKIDKDVLDKISFAMLAQKYLTFVYTNRKKQVKKRKVAPYAIIYSEYTYLVAKEENQDIYKHFLLYQMRDVEVSDDDYFDKDEKFDLKEHLSKSFGAFQDNNPMNVKLQFSKEVKEIVEEYSFHPTQEITPNPDGTTTVTFTACGDLEICWFLFRWGKNVKILSPKKLKDTYKKLLEEAKEQI